eukprot:5387202-Ditylum_brightwellii.AAC.2
MTSTSARMKVEIDKHEDSELNNEWLTEGEALTHQIQRQQDALGQSAPVHVDRSFPSQYEETTPNESTLLRSKENLSAPDSLESGKTKIELPQPTSELKTPPYLTSGEEEVAMPKMPNSEGDTTQETGFRRSNYQRRTPTKYTSAFGPISRWQSNQTQAMYSTIEDISLLEEDWTEIKTLMAQMNTERSFKHPKTLQLADTAIAAIRNDPDTPSLIETLSGEN